MIDDETVDPEDLADEEEGDPVDEELKELQTTRKKDVQEDEVDGDDLPRTAENRKAAQS
jgi:hypothetical protein